MDRTGTFPIRRLRRDESHNIRPRLSHTVDSGQPKSTRRVCRSTEAGRASQCIDYAMTIGRVPIIIYIIHLRPLVIQRPMKVHPNDCNSCRIPIDARHFTENIWQRFYFFANDLSTGIFFFSYEGHLWREQRAVLSSRKLNSLAKAPRRKEYGLILMFYLCVCCEPCLPAPEA